MAEEDGLEVKNDHLQILELSSDNCLDRISMLLSTLILGRLTSKKILIDSRSPNPEDAPGIVSPQFCRLSQPNQPHDQDKKVHNFAVARFLIKNYTKIILIIAKQPSVHKERRLDLPAVLDPDFQVLLFLSGRAVLSTLST